MAEQGGDREVDVARIMENIRERVAEKKASGVYTGEEIEEVSRMELSIKESMGFGEEMDGLLSWLHAHWEATGPPELAPQEGGSPFRESAKRFLRACMEPAGRLILGRQNQINARIVQLLSGALPPLRDGLHDAEERLDSVAAGLDEENRKLRERLDRCEARLERLEKSETQADGRRGSGT